MRQSRPFSDASRYDTPVISLARYSSLLAQPELRSAIAASVLGRLPIGITGLAVLMLAQDTTGSFGTGGAVAACYVAGLAIVAPLLGRLIDRYGPSSILLLRAAATILDAGEPLSLDGEDVAGSLGLGHHGGRRSSLCHTLERLQLFGLAGLNDPDVTVQTVLSPMSARRLAQTPSSVQQAHHSLLRAHTATASRLEPTSR